MTEAAKAIVTSDDGDAIEMPQSQADNNVQAEHEAMLSGDEPVSALEQPNEPEAPETPEPEINGREAKLEAIAAKRLADMQASEAETEQRKPEAEEPKTHTLKVSGEEQTVTDDELRALAQKGLAADKKFEEAAALRKQTDSDRIKELEDKLAQLSAVSLPTDATKPALPDDGPMQFTPETIDKVVFSGDEDSAQAREEMARRLNQQPVNPTEIKEQIRAEMRIEQAIDSVSESDPIAKQMLGDDKMRQVVDRYSGILLELEPNLSEAENIAKAAQQARLHFPELTPPQPAMTPAKQVAQTKQAHAAGNVTAPAQRINVAPEPLTEEQLRAQAKAQLRAGRGLQN